MKKINDFILNLFDKSKTEEDKKLDNIAEERLDRYINMSFKMARDSFERMTDGKIPEADYEIVKKLIKNKMHDELIEKLDNNKEEGLYEYIDMSFKILREYSENSTGVKTQKLDPEIIKKLLKYKPSDDSIFYEPQIDCIQMENKTENKTKKSDFNLNNKPKT